MNYLNSRNAFLGLGLLATAVIGGQACSAADTGKPLDANGDGVADDLNAVTIDADGDGKPDMIDLNGDGKFAIGLDTNGDGILDAEGLDTDGDGIIDCIDKNGDGTCDISTGLGTGGTNNDGPDIGGLDQGSTGGGSNGGDDDNPATCAQAEASKSYIGCEFWPTITYNPVYTDFDFAVVLANGGATDATVTVTGNGQNISETVPAGGLKAIILPWVMELKGGEFSRANTSGSRPTASVLKVGGAYRVASDVPVTAWQFNPLQYKKPIAAITGGGGLCGTQFGTADCYSASNDASLLIPTSAMTNSYRVFTRSEIQSVNGGFNSASGGMAITATKDGTSVQVQLGPNCKTGMADNCIAAGTGVAAADASAVVTYTMNAGDVLELLGKPGAFEDDPHADVSGSIVVSDKPVQVIGFNPISNIPNSTVANADHIEELVLPAEVLGKSYIVAAPTSPSGAAKGGHIVRFFGNVDGTTLTYDTKPAGAPDTLAAGQVVEIGPLLTPFMVTGTQPFEVGSFMQGGQAQGSGACPNFPCSGDPAFSVEVTPEQFRKQYTFLAPSDYDVNFADVLIPDGAVVTIDGAPLTGTNEPVTAGWTLQRVPLTGGDGSHRLVSDKPVGLQVMGFGHATSYYYPGGLNLKLISPPVDVVK